MRHVCTCAIAKYGVCRALGVKRRRPVRNTVRVHKRRRCSSLVTGDAYTCTCMRECQHKLFGGWACLVACAGPEKRLHTFECVRTLGRTPPSLMFPFHRTECQCVAAVIAVILRCCALQTTVCSVCWVRRSARDANGRLRACHPPPPPHPLSRGVAARVPGGGRRGVVLTLCSGWFVLAGRRGCAQTRGVRFCQDSRKIPN